MSETAAGFLPPNAVGNEYLTTEFIADQVLSRISTVMLVKVVAVTNAGGVQPVGFVDVQMLVNQVDGNGKPTPHGVIHNIPYFRIQGGANAVIIDPVVGDIGMCGFCSRDISSVKTAKSASNPASFRRFDAADGLYFGGYLNGTPTQYVRMAGNNMTLHSPGIITLEAPTVTVTATNINLNGAVAGAGTWQNNGHDVGSGHVHTGVQSGGSNTGPPL